MRSTRTVCSAILATIAILASGARGTTCVWGKKFKVRQACGQVKDSAGAAIPSASVQVSRLGQPEKAIAVETDAEGKFQFSGISDGEYQMRVKFAGFWDASQPFVVTGAKANPVCTNPIRIVMKPAGQCSYVENAWKKAESH